MSLSSGARLGPYEIHPTLGASGMGGVHRDRARLSEVVPGTCRYQHLPSRRGFTSPAPQLDRAVALKILPADFALDEERMQRFTREADRRAPPPARR